MLKGLVTPPAQDLRRDAKPAVLSQKPPQASILGLLLSLCLWLDVSAQEATPGFVSRLAAVTPMPALAQAAKANHIPLEQIDPSVETNRVSPGDSFTAVVALFSRRPETQWLLFLQGVEPTPKELKENSPGSMVIYNTLGHKLEFPSAPAFVALRTMGPFVAGETRKKPGDETTRFVLDQGYLGLGLEQAAAAMLRMHRSGVKGPCMSGTEPFGDDVTGKCRKADESWHINPAEERALAGSFPALLSYFKTAQEAPELLDILAKALDRPSLWSLLWHGGHQQHRISLGRDPYSTRRCVSLASVRTPGRLLLSDDAVSQSSPLAGPDNGGNGAAASIVVLRRSIGSARRKARG